MKTLLQLSFAFTKSSLCVVPDESEFKVLMPDFILIDPTLSLSIMAGSQSELLPVMSTAILVP